MINAAEIINEISKYLDRFSLKSNKLSKQDLIYFIEEKWKQADDEKYKIHQGRIIIGRMTNEYIWAKDFENMMRWLNISDLYESPQKHPNYISNYYKGQCCLECGNEEEALKYFNLCYNENPDYIFTRAPFCYKFFNEYLKNPRDLPKENMENEEVYYELELPEWQMFFKEDSKCLHYKLLDSEGEEVDIPSSIHKKGLEYLQKNQIEILHNILTKLKIKYFELQKIYNYEGQDKIDFMPDISEVGGFSELLTPTGFFVISDGEQEFPNIGFSFWCSWDAEHGLGIMTHKDSVIEIGGADCAFQL